MIIIYFLLLTSFLFSNGKDAEETLNKYSNEIKEAAEQTGISSRLLAGIIYAEHKLNYNLEDEILDGIFAQIGYNSSVGIAQIKVNTAEWIEEQIHNKNSVFYLGEKIAYRIPYTDNRSKILDMLSNPKTNILFAACYVTMIEKLWGEEFNFFSLGNIKTGIIATLYSLGIVNEDGKIRYPHPGAKMNNFGKTAQEFYDSFRLRNSFPK